jgi:HEAT repeat protein
VKIISNPIIVVGCLLISIVFSGCDNFAKEDRDKEVSRLLDRLEGLDHAVDSQTKKEELKKYYLKLSNDNNLPYLLSEVNREDISPKRKTIAINALGVIGGEEAEKSIIKCATDHDRMVKLFSIFALKGFPSSDSRNVLLNLAKNDESEEVKIAAVLSLGKINEILKDDEISSFIAKEKDSPNTKMRDIARRIIELQGENSPE